jgi:DNA-binding response OmpR family regulator
MTEAQLAEPQLRIVVLDDDEWTRAVTCELLGDAGFEPVGVGTTLGLRKALSPGAAVLCDVSPPRKFAQIVETAREVRAITGPRTPLVLCGSQPAVQLGILVRACSATGYVERSKDAEVLVERLATLVRRAERASNAEPHAPHASGSMPVARETAKDAVRVLLIDDDELTLEILQSGLLAGGYEVRIALSLGEVRSIIDGWQPAVIVADVNMPDMRGDDLCARLKAAAHTRDAVIVLCSGMPDAELEELARRARADGWVSKRGGVYRVATLLQATLRRRRGT